MIELVRYHTQRKDESCQRVALVKEGTKWLTVLPLTATGQAPMGLWKVEKSDRRYMKPLMRGRKPYPMKRAIRGFRRLAKTHGITKGAKKFLKEAASA